MLIRWLLLGLFLLGSMPYISGQETHSRPIVNLIQFAETHMHDKIRMDYFDVSYPEMQVWDLDLNKKNRTHCHYIRGLGYLGKRKSDQAAADFKQVLELESSHSGAWIHLQFLKADSLIK